MGALGPDIRHEENHLTAQKGKKHVFVTSDNFPALDSCIYVYVHGLCFQDTLWPKQIHSRRVQVRNKQVSSAVLVYVCGLFSSVNLLCFVL